MERLQRIVYTNPLLVDLDREKEELDRKLAAVPEDTLLISMERLFGSIHYHLYNHGYITTALGHLFPGAKIIMVIRRQDDLLESLYRQCLRRYVFPRLDGFLQYTGHGFVDPSTTVMLSFPSINPRILDFGRYVAGYAAVFGADNVLVLAFELLKADSRQFLARLFGFMRVAPVYPDDSRLVNLSYSLASCRIARLLNRFVRAEWRESSAIQFIPDYPFNRYLSGRRSRDDLWYRVLAAINRRLSLNYFLEHVVDTILPARGRLIDDRRRRLIMSLHAESNRALDEARGLGLKQFGYY